MMEFKIIIIIIIVLQSSYSKLHFLAAAVLSAQFLIFLSEVFKFLEE